MSFLPGKHKPIFSFQATWRRRLTTRRFFFCIQPLSEASGEPAWFNESSSWTCPKKVRTPSRPLIPAVQGSTQPWHRIFCKKWRCSRPTVPANAAPSGSGLAIRACSKDVAYAHPQWSFIHPAMKSQSCTRCWTKYQVHWKSEVNTFHQVLYLALQKGVVKAEVPCLRVEGALPRTQMEKKWGSVRCPCISPYIT